jgi:hypothetical protein
MVEVLALGKAPAKARAPVMVLESVKREIQVQLVARGPENVRERVFARVLVFAMDHHWRQVSHVSVHLCVMEVCSAHTALVNAMGGVFVLKETFIISAREMVGVLGQESVQGQVPV